MMSTLADVLNFIGYKSQIEQLAIIKLLAYRGGFSKPFLPQNNLSPIVQKRIEKICITILFWEKLSLKVTYPEYLGKVISDHESKGLLKLPFSNLEEGYLWLLNVTQLTFLRESFDKEGVGIEKEKLAINTTQWCVSDEKEIADIEQNKENIDFNLFQCCKFLHLFDAQPWLHQPNTKYMVFLSSMENYVADRIRFIPEFGGTIYFLSGARGLFNNEPSLAPILADWFNAPEQQQVIQNILDDHTDFKDPKNWTRNLFGLKQEILTAINRTTWCNAEGKSYYYEDLLTFDKQSELNGRESLKNWPVAMDMFVYLFKKHTQTNPNSFKNIKFVQVLSIGKQDRLPTTSDFIETWFQQYGKKLISQGKIPVFVACNATYRLSLVLNNLQRAQYYQDALTKQSMANKLQQFRENNFYEKNLSAEDMHIRIVGPVAKKFSLTRALDVLARSLWPLNDDLKARIQQFESLELSSCNENKNSRQSFFVRSMICYQACNKFVMLANAAVDLALCFYLANDHIKASGLFNFAIDVLETITQEDLLDLIAMLQNCTFVNLNNFINLSKKQLNSSTIDVDIQYLKKQHENTKGYLSAIRKQIYQKFIQIKVIDKDEIVQIYKECHHEMREFFISLINQSVKLLGQYKGALSFAYLGSNSRKQATPYSDVEFFILTNDIRIDFPKELTKLILLKILNLRETVLRSLGISVSDNKGNEFNLKSSVFDAYTKRGFSFDFNDRASACKTPLGVKLDGKVFYRLIGTPQQIGDLSGQLGYQKDPEFPQLLRLSKQFFGDRGLFIAYKNILIKQTQFDLITYCNTILIRDIDKYLGYLNEIENLQIVNHKNYFFRCINLFIDGLYMAISPNENVESYEKITRLCQLGLIDQNQKQVLQDVLTWSLYLRIKQHLFFQQNKLQISLLEPEGIRFKKLLMQLKEIYIFYKQQLTQQDSSLNKKIFATVQSTRVPKQLIANRHHFFSQYKGRRHSISNLEGKLSTSYLANHRKI